MVGAVEQLWALGERSPTAERLAARWMPGPLTLVLPTTRKLPTGVSRDGTIGLRVPDHPVTLALADDLPVITTSANRRGEPPAESLAEAYRSFGDSVHYLDGATPRGVASTIVFIPASGDCKVLREGVISTEELEALLAS